MKITNSVKGYFLALIAVIAVSNVYIFSKAALAEVSLPQFGFYWFSFGLLWVLLFAWYRKSFSIFKSLSVKNYVILFILGIFDVVGTYFFFKAINTVPDPTIVSFIGNISPALVISLSVIVLKEQFNKLEILGVILALVGAFIISYKGAGINELFIDGAQYVLFSGILGAINVVVIKRNIKKILPVVLIVNRTSFLLLFSLIAMFVLNESFDVSSTALKNIFIGSVLGPFLTVIAGYLALQFIPLSRKAIIGSTKGLFVLVGSYIYFGNFPQTIALIGGFVTIIGVLLIAFGKMKLKKQIRTK
jgi:drug/metabolite transporter (DMT)-like permease